MKLTKSLMEYLENRDFYNLFEIANTIADYKEKKHQDNREISEEIWDLAERYVNKMEMYLEDEERTRKRDDEYVKDMLFDYLNNVLVRTYDDLLFVAKDKLKKEWIKIDSQALADYLSEFIDKKELYNLIY